MLTDEELAAIRERAKKARTYEIVDIDEISPGLVAFYFALDVLALLEHIEEMKDADRNAGK